MPESWQPCAVCLTRYRAAKNGQLDHRDARSRIWMLAQIGNSIEVAEIEKTLARLEEALASRPTEGPLLPKHDPAATRHWRQ